MISRQPTRHSPLHSFLHFPSLPQSHIYYERVNRNTACVGWRKNYPYTLYFFRNKTFLFVKIESWNFQQLFDLGFLETLQNFSSFRQTFRWHFCGGIRVVWMSWNFVRFYEVINQKDAKNFRFPPWQSFPCTLDSSFFS